MNKSSPNNTSLCISFLIIIPKKKKKRKKKKMEDNSLLNTALGIDGNRFSGDNARNQTGLYIFENDIGIIFILL